MCKRSFLIIFLGYFAFVFADIGRDDFVDCFTSLQPLSDGQRIAKFACLLGGFKLNNASVSATFDSFFPVRGDIVLNDGTLMLSRDLICKDVTTIKNLGNIVGNNMVLDLSSTITSFPSDGNATVVFSDLAVFLRGDVYINESEITFNGNSVIHGRGNLLTLSPTTILKVGANSSLRFEDITIKNVNNKKIQCTDDSSTVEFRNVSWIQDDDYIFDAGKFDVLGEFHVFGDGYTFIYQTDQISTVSVCSAIILDNNLTFSYDPPGALRDLIELSQVSSQFVLNGATLHSTAAGLRLKKGRLVIDRRSFISSDGQEDGESISFGDGGDAENNLGVQFLPAATLEIIKGFVAYNNV